jgi:RNA polymerase sigma-70 factor (ECF subfamily)
MIDHSRTHATLIARLSDRSDPTAWPDFCDRYGELIRRFALRQNVESAECDDVMQDVLIALTKNMPTFQYDPAKGRFRSYLKTLVVRAVFRRFRQKRAQGGQVDIEAAVDEVVTDPQVEEIWNEEWRQYHLRQAMQTIAVEFNPADRAAFDAYVGEGRPAKETAETLGMTVDQVYQAKSRILKRLSELIAAQTGEEG